MARARDNLIRLSDRTREAESSQRVDEFLELEDERARELERRAKPWRAHLLAAVLGLESDPVRAAALAGLEVHGAELAELVAEARKHKDLTDGKSSAIAALMSTAISMAAVRMACTLYTVPPAQVSTSIRALAQAREILQGEHAPEYAAINISIRAPTDEGNES